MPSWNIHLAVGEKLNQKLNFTGEQRDNFLLGCLLPDINNGYVNDVRVKKRHHETHWTFDEKSSLNFFAKYKQEIGKREPIYLGYLAHLYADGFFNYQFDQLVKNSDFAKLDVVRRSEVKHNDFWKYDLKYEQMKFFVNDKVAACRLANRIDNIDVNEAEIAIVEDLLKQKVLSDASRNRQYMLYSEEKLDQVLEQMVMQFEREYL